jgi:hypothetical protein
VSAVAHGKSLVQKAPAAATNRSTFAFDHARKGARLVYSAPRRSPVNFARSRLDQDRLRIIFVGASGGRVQNVCDVRLGTLRRPTSGRAASDRLSASAICGERGL